MKNILRILFVLIVASAAHASIANIFYAQTSAGGNNGTSCANAYAVGDVTNGFSIAGKWGAGSTQIGQDTIVHLCGTITSALAAQGSGASGHPVTVLWESGAKISMGACGTTGCLNLDTRGWFVVDGGTNGIIEATNSGTGLGSVDSVAIHGRSGMNNTEIKNLTISNMYVHDGTGNDTASGDYYALYFDGTNNSFHNNVIHDALAAVKEENGSSGNVFYQNKISNINWGIFLSASSVNGIINESIHDNDIHDFANWDTSSDTFHHDGIFLSGFNAPSTDLQNVDIYNNYIHGSASIIANCSTNCMTAYMYVNAARHIRIFNNILVAPTGQFVNNGWLLMGAPGFQDTNNAVYNNTIIGGTGPGGTDGCVRLIAQANVSFENNVVSNCGTLVWTDGATNFSPGFPAPPVVDLPFPDAQANQYGGPWQNCTGTACAGGSVNASVHTFTYPDNTQTRGDNLSAKTTTTGPGGGVANALYYLTIGPNNAVDSFLWDHWVYVDSLTNAQALEYDQFQFSGGWRYMMGTQCDLAGGVWDVWNSGTTSWVATTIPCTSATFAAATWHHIQLYTTADHGSHTYTYRSMFIDGVQHTMGQVEPAKNTGESDNSGIQYQTDIKSTGGTVNEWIDNSNFYMWTGGVATALDYNTYQNPGTLSGSWRKDSTFFNTLTAWQTATSADSHSQALTGILKLDAQFTPIPGSPVINTATNLSILAISGLQNDRLMIPRPITAPWHAGAVTGTPKAYLPQRQVDMTFTMPSGCSWTPGLPATPTCASNVGHFGNDDGDGFQYALDHQNPGDKIFLTANHTYQRSNLNPGYECNEGVGQTGDFLAYWGLPARLNPSNLWTYILSSDLASLPPGVRVNTATSPAHMFRLNVQNLGTAFCAGANASHYRMVGGYVTSTSISGANTANEPWIAGKTGTLTYLTGAGYLGYRTVQVNGPNGVLTNGGFMLDVAPHFSCLPIHLTGNGSPQTVTCKGTGTHWTSSPPRAVIDVQAQYGQAPDVAYPETMTVVDDTHASLAITPQDLRNDFAITGWAVTCTVTVGSCGVNFGNTLTLTSNTILKSQQVVTLNGFTAPGATWMNGLQLTVQGANGTSFYATMHDVRTLSSGSDTGSAKPEGLGVHFFHINTVLAAGVGECAVTTCEEDAFSSDPIIIDNSPTINEVYVTGTSPHRSTIQTDIEVTAWAITSNSLTLTALNDVVPGMHITLSGFTGTSSFLNLITFNMTSVAAASGGHTVYSGTIASGNADALVNRLFTVTGFTNAANNGVFLCTSSSLGSLTLANTAGVVETHAGVAKVVGSNILTVVSRTNTSITANYIYQNSSSGGTIAGSAIGTDYPITITGFTSGPHTTHFNTYCGTTVNAPCTQASFSRFITSFDNPSVDTVNQVITGTVSPESGNPNDWTGQITVSVVTGSTMLVIGDIEVAQAYLGLTLTDPKHPLCYVNVVPNYNFLDFDHGAAGTTVTAMVTQHEAVAGGTSCAAFTSGGIGTTAPNFNLNIGGSTGTAPAIPSNGGTVLQSWTINTSNCTAAGFTTSGYCGEAVLQIDPLAIEGSHHIIFDRMLITGFNPDNGNSGWGDIHFCDNSVQDPRCFAATANNQSVHISSVSLTSNVATITTGLSSFVKNQSVTVSGLATTTLNGTFTVLSATATSVSYAKTNANIAPTADSGTASGIYCGQLNVPANAYFNCHQNTVLIGLRNDSGSFGMTDSVVTEINNDSVQESHAVFQLFGSGSQRYCNNQFSATTESVFSGGAYNQAQVSPTTPSDHIFGDPNNIAGFGACAPNYYTKPLFLAPISTKAQNQNFIGHVLAKNEHEDKNAVRQVISGNVLGPEWQSAQSNCFDFTPRTAAAPQPQGNITGRNTDIWVDSNLCKKVTLFSVFLATDPVAQPMIGCTWGKTTSLTNCKVAGINSTAGMDWGGYGARWYFTNDLVTLIDSQDPLNLPFSSTYPAPDFTEGTLNVTMSHISILMDQSNNISGGADKLAAPFINSTYPGGAVSNPNNAGALGLCNSIPAPSSSSTNFYLWDNLFANAPAENGGCLSVGGTSSQVNQTTANNFSSREFYWPNTLECIVGAADGWKFRDAGNVWSVGDPAAFSPQTCGVGTGAPNPNFAQTTASAPITFDPSIGLVNWPSEHYQPLFPNWTGNTHDGKQAGADVVAVNAATATAVSGATCTVNPQISNTSLPTGALSEAYSASLSATCGVPPYSHWIVSSGTAPSGVSLDINFGILSGSPTATGTFTFSITVQDSLGNTSAAAPFTVVINPALVITTTSPLPDATVGSSYGQTLNASGGVFPPYGWDVTSGPMVLCTAGLYHGLCLVPTSGVIQGMPTTAEVITSTYRVTDANGTPAHASKVLTLTVVAGAALNITTTSLLDGKVGVSYSQTVHATGGTPSYTWSVPLGGLPPGLGINSSSGIISGLPTADGNFNFTVHVVDAASNFADKPLSIHVTAFTIDNTSFPGGVVQLAYSSPALTASNGISPISWDVSVGALPPGLAIVVVGSDTFIQGVPTTAGSFSFTLRATDSTTPTHLIATKPFTIVISPNSAAGVERGNRLSPGIRVQ